MHKKTTTNLDSLLDGNHKPIILIVDDSPTIRVSLSRSLQKEFTPIEASDGEQAWQMLSNDHRIEVVMTDLSMPGLDGFGLVQRIRASEVNHIKNIPVIVVTGADDTAAREKAFLTGANDFVTKNSDQVELLARLRAHRKLALTIRELEASQRELLEQTNIDPLTNLASRHLFTLIASKELSLMRRQKEYFSLLVLNIDHFNDIHETYGRAAGNHVLIQVAQALTDSLREEDMIARVRNEEFVVGSPYTNRLTAIVLAERLRKAVEKLDISFEGNHIAVTASIGVALQPNDGDDLDTILAAANERLHTAKDSGHNRFCAADKQHDEHEAGVDMVCPGLDEAVAMIKHGNLQRLMPHIPKLLEELVPLFELANEESAVKIDITQMRELITTLQTLK